MNARRKRWTRAIGIGGLAVTVLATLNLPVRAVDDIPQQTAQRHRPDPDAALRTMPIGGFGAPLPNLSREQVMAFAAGMDEFSNVETVASGLGPIFNDRSCAACHSVPALGGSSDRLVTRFGRTTDGQFDPLASLGGSLLQKQAIAPGALEVVPTVANTTAHRQTTPLFGLGLIEAIPDQEILANAAREPAMGVHGTPSFVDDVASGKTRVGRFGWKAQQATLLAFSGDAYLNEMGITNRFFPTENAPNGNTAVLARYDHVKDPEDTVDPATGKSDIDAFADFMRLLAPPPPLPPNRSARAGAPLFAQTGCAACHQPQMQAGPSPVQAIDHATVHLYSDLLLHDMGKLGDGIAQGTANAGQMKTAPLWGLRASAPYLHDGRAATVDAAIRAHDGDATHARVLYERLSPVERQQLLDFLASL